MIRLTTRQRRAFRRLGPGLLAEIPRCDVGETPKMLSRTPHPRQADFLNLQCKESLYGGAAGGGKTDALLMWLAEGVNTPGYSGLFFRRTFAQLAKSNDSPITKSHEMYRELGGRYKASEHKWLFPSGASIEFGHMQHEMSVMNYQGPAYHRVAFDELTQFSETQYTYLFSRMRRRKDFPIRPAVRASANPGGPGHVWVKKRFVTKEAESAIRSLDHYQPSPAGLVFWPTEERAFVPARVADNPSLEVREYVEQMMADLPDLLRQQLLNGDWSAVAGSLIDGALFERYESAGDAIWLLDDVGKRSSMIDQRTCRRIATVDTAGSSKERADEKKGKPSSHSVISIWDIRGRKMMLRHVARGKWDWPQLKASAVTVLKHWNVRETHVENQTVGRALVSELREAGIHAVEINSVIEGMNTNGGDPKYERAVAAGLFKILGAGDMYLPVAGSVPWLADYEGELTTWQGFAGEQTDQIDVTSYACCIANKGSRVTGGLIKPK